MFNVTPIVSVNGSDRSWTHHRYIFAFGAHGNYRLMVWANSVEDALDHCTGWIEENAPGLFCDDAVAQEFNDAKAQGLTDEEATEIAETDVTTLDGTHYIPSWEWTIVAEDPTRSQILELQGRA